MDRRLILWIVSLLTAFICCWKLTFAVDDKSQQENYNSDEFDPRNGLFSSKQLTSINRQPNRHKRVCAIGGGMNSQCTTSNVDQQMKMRERLMNSFSPGKRNEIVDNTPEVDDDDLDDDLDDEVQQTNSHGDDLNGNSDEESSNISKNLLIRRILGELSTDVAKTKKKTCLFNLGGHCSTESAAFLADRWHYLDSPQSPGRKRSSKAVGASKALEERQMIDDRK